MMNPFSSYWKMSICRLILRWSIPRIGIEEPAVITEPRAQFTKM